MNPTVSETVVGRPRRRGRALRRVGWGIVLAGVLTATAPGAALAGPQAAGQGQRHPTTLALLGKTVFLDPGHQGSAPGQNLGRPVSDGYGGSKACQTTGATTVDGVPEHTVNWQVAGLVRAALQSLGAHVVLSRPDDVGWGGCIDERARAAAASDADVAVSIHADSAGAQERGFHLIEPQLSVADPIARVAQADGGRRASAAVRSAYRAAGFPEAHYGGAIGGIQTRRDIAGPALSRVPQVFVEMGNGANRADAADLESPVGQFRHAMAITTGVASYLVGVPMGPTAAPALTPARGLTSPAAQTPQTDRLGLTGPTSPLPEFLLAAIPPGAIPNLGTEGLTELVGAAAQSLGPLAQALGIDGSGGGNGMIDLVYAVFSALFAPGR